MTDMKFIPVMSVLAIVGVGALLILNSLPMFESVTKGTHQYLSHNDVKGMAISHQKKLYTLNFQQQNAVIDFLNRAISVSRSAKPADGQDVTDFDKIIIYRFGAADITLSPVTLIQNNLLFDVPEWNPGGYIQDTSNGALLKLLSETYDS